MEREEAPAHLEAALHQAFRQHYRKPVWRRSWFSAAIAAALMLAAGLAWIATRQQRPVVVVQQPAPAPAPPKVVESAPVVAEVKPAVKPRPRRARIRPQPAPKPVEAPPPEVATEFIPVGYSGPLTQADTGRIVRVRVPRSAMTGFGFPVNPDRLQESVKADVMLGDGGMIRAIRFVQ
jgi:hypothetical protein